MSPIVQMKPIPEPFATLIAALHRNPADRIALCRLIDDCLDAGLRHTVMLQEALEYIDNTRHSTASPSEWYFLAFPIVYIEEELIEHANQ